MTEPLVADLLGKSAMLAGGWWQLGDCFAAMLSRTGVAVQGILEVLVTDFQGKPATVAGVRLMAAEKQGTPPLLEKLLQQSSEKAGVWTFDFLSERKDLGLWQ